MLTFVRQGEHFVDVETGSTWWIGGKAESGELSGTTLAPLLTRTAFWFYYVTAFPEVTVFQP